MTLADLPVLNPSTPSREARRAGVVAALFAVFGVLYALVRAANVVPPDPTTQSGDPFGFAFPRGWGIVRATWSGAATLPSRLAASGLETTLAVAAVVVLAIALVIVMHPDILSRQGPQYVSPARRLTTVVIALILAFLVYAGVARIDGIFTSELQSSPDRAPRVLIGLGMLSALLFGGIWSFIGPKDFGRRIPLRISHGAMGGLGLWAAVTFATYLSAQPRLFLSTSLDTFYTLLTLDAAAGTPGATLGWAVTADVLTAAVAMAVAGGMLIVTAPQSLGPGNRRGSALVTSILGAFLAMVAFTTYTQSRERSDEVSADVVAALGLETVAPVRTPLLLTGQQTSPTQRVVSRFPTVPHRLAGDCINNPEDRPLPAATSANVARLQSYVQAQGGEMHGTVIRATSCLAALQALRWDPVGARTTVFLNQRPERAGALTYLYATSGVAANSPQVLRRLLAALSDTSRFQHGSEAAQRFADLARIAGDTVAEASWRQRVIQPTGQAAMGSLLARPAYVDGSISGRIQSARRGWRVALLAIPDPSGGADPMMVVPRGEDAILTWMVAATDTDTDGRFSFTGLRDGWYMLALLGPEGDAATAMTNLTVRGDPGPFRLEPTRKARDLGTIRVDY